MLIKRGISHNIDKVENKLKIAFNKIKNEIDDHRQAINENTNEIQSNYEYMCKIDTKLDKLSKTVEELSLFVHQMAKIEPENKIDLIIHTKKAQLTITEQNILSFLIHTNENDYITYAVIAEQLEMAEREVLDYISNMISKGVPIIKRYISDTVILHLNSEFKSEQIKQEIGHEMLKSTSVY